MKKIILDGKCMQDKETLHLYLKSKLNVQEYYGSNLDALWDVLSNYDLKTTFYLTNKEEMLEGLSDYGEALIQVFSDATQENSNINFQIINNHLLVINTD